MDALQFHCSEVWYMGWAPHGVQAGDVFCLFDGCIVPFYFVLQVRGIHSLCGAMGMFTDSCLDSSLGLKEAQSNGSSLYEAVDPWMVGVGDIEGIS